MKLKLYLSISIVCSLNFNLIAQTEDPMLEVEGAMIAVKGDFTGNGLNDEVFVDYDDGIDKSVVFSAGKLIPNSTIRRVFSMHDMSMGTPYDFDAVLFHMRDRLGKERLKINLFSGLDSYSEFELKDKDQAEILKVKGNADEAYLQMPKTNTRFIIGGFSDNPIIEDNRFVVLGNSLFDGSLGINTVVADDTQLSISANDKTGIKSITNHSTDYQVGILSAVNRPKTKALSVNLLENGTYIDKFVVLGNGKVLATEVEIKIPIFPDYVFETDYELMPLDELKVFIANNKHLPNIPKAEKIVAEGMNLGNMQVKQMEKIEELTLYILEQEERIKKLEGLVKQLLEVKMLKIEE